MSALDTRLIFAVLGALFVLLGGVNCWRARSVTPRARTWLLLGLIFCGVAAWLTWMMPGFR